MGKGIAIAGIWIGVGIVGLNDREGWTVGVALLAMFATVFVTLSSF